MRSDRLLAVADALEDALVKKLCPEQSLPPGFFYGRYAVRHYEKTGPDLELEKVNENTLCDIAAWTCWLTPALCEPLPGPQTFAPAARFYYENAKRILDLTVPEADALFVFLGEKLGKTAEQVTVQDAVDELRNLAASAALGGGAAA